MIVVLSSKTTAITIVTQSRLSESTVEPHAQQVGMSGGYSFSNAA